MRTHILRISLVGALLAGLPAGSAAQVNFSVDPLLLSLGDGINSAVLTITNSSPREVRFEIKAFTWDQTPDGQSALTDTKDIVVFPPLITVKPKMIQRVRVGTTAKAGATERAFRLMIEELPSATAPPTANTVAVRTRIGVPVFIEPVKIARSGTIGNVQITNRSITVPLQNTGNVHAMVDSVSVRGMAGPDEVVWEQEAQGWYVLAGKTRQWSYQFRPRECSPVKFVEIEVVAHDRVLTRRAEMPAGACNP
jgi:fimbrial chaperone protein